MTTQYRHKRNQDTRKKLAIIGAISACLIFFGINVLTSGALSQGVRAVLFPILQRANGYTTGPVGDFFSSRSTLMSKNTALEQEVEALRQQLRVENIYTEDNAQFCRVLVEEDFIGASAGAVVPALHLEEGLPVGTVVSYERLYFGTILVSVSTTQLPAVGAIVIDEAKVPIGTVQSMQGRFATVSLFTNAHDSTEVRIKKSVTTMKGKSGSTLLMQFPREASVAVGDVVLHVASGLPVATVTRVDLSPADAESTVYARPLSTLSQVRTVRFIESPQSVL
jgi:cell shape-determining protein MreC